MREDTKPPNQKFSFPVGLRRAPCGRFLLQTGLQKYLLNSGLAAARNDSSERALP